MAREAGAQPARSRRTAIGERAAGANPPRFGGRSCAPRSASGAGSAIGAVDAVDERLDALEF